MKHFHFMFLLPSRCNYIYDISAFFHPLLLLLYVVVNSAVEQCYFSLSKKGEGPSMVLTSSSCNFGDRNKGPSSKEKEGCLDEGHNNLPKQALKLGRKGQKRPKKLSIVGPLRSAVVVVVQARWAGPVGPVRNTILLAWFRHGTTWVSVPCLGPRPDTTR